MYKSFNMDSMQVCSVKSEDLKRGGLVKNRILTIIIITKIGINRIGEHNLH